MNDHGLSKAVHTGTGKDSSCLKELNKLEPTFAICEYSARCYRKAQEVFRQYEVKNKRPLKQTIFLKLS